MSFFKKFPYVGYDYYGNGVVTNVVEISRFVRYIEEFKEDLDLYTYYEIQEGDRPDVISQLLYDTPEYYWTFFIVNDILRQGISSWPLSSMEFEKYMAEEYNGVAVTCRSEYIYDGDGLLVSIENSLADRFEIGETMVGFLSGATGVLKSKDPSKQQMIITDVVGTFQENEIIRGNYTEDSVTSYTVTDWQLAPHHYEDFQGREVDNSIYITGGHPFTLSNIVTYREYETRLNEERSRIRVVRPEHIFEFSRTYEKLVKTV